MIRVLLLCLLGLTASASVDLYEFDNLEQELRYRALAEELRCLVCQNQNIADSDAGLARDLKDQVVELIKSGRSDAEIKDYLVQRYGDFVLYDPPFKAQTLLLWLGPLVFIVFAIAIVIIINRQKKSAPSYTGTPDDKDDLTRILEEDEPQ